jgi:E3 Ubiquitin ligase
MGAYEDLSRSVIEIVVLVAPYLLVMVMVSFARLFLWLDETYPFRLAKHLLERLERARGAQRAGLRQSLQKLPSVRIADAPEGAIVKLVGRVRPADGPLRSPLKGEACVFFETTVYERVDDGAEPRAVDLWDECAQESKSVNFWLEDDTGRVLVRAAGWLVVPSVGAAEVSPEGLGDAPPGVKALLKRQRLLRPGVPVASLPLRLSERVFAPGDRVEVVGRVRRELDPDPTSYRAQLKRLVIEVPPNGPLLASPAPDPA